GKIPRSLLGRDLDMGVSGDQFLRNRNPIHDLDALPDQRVIFHIAHGDEAINAGEAQPVDHVRHQLLKSRVLYAGDAFCALEIGSSSIAILLALAGIVDQEFGDLAKCAAFLAIVHDDAEPTGLPGANAFLDAVYQVGTAGADVGAEHVRSVALIMHAASDLG